MCSLSGYVNTVGVSQEDIDYVLWELVGPNPSTSITSVRGGANLTYAGERKDPKQNDDWVRNPWCGCPLEARG